MPKFEDLPFLKDKIASIADEVEVMKKKGKTPNLVQLPQEEKLDSSKSYDDLLSDGLLEDIPGGQEEDLAASVAKEKERSRSLEEAMEQNEPNTEVFSEESSIDGTAVPTEDNSSEDSDSLILPDNDLSSDETDSSLEKNDLSIDEADFLSIKDDNDKDSDEPISEIAADTDFINEDFSKLGDLSIDSFDTGDDLPLDNSFMMDDDISSGDFNMDSLLSADDFNDFNNLDALQAEDISEDDEQKTAEEDIQAPKSELEAAPAEDAETLPELSDDDAVEDALPAADDFDNDGDLPNTNKMPDLPSLSIDGDDEIDLSNMLNDSTADGGDDENLLDLSSLDDLSLSDDEPTGDGLPNFDSLDFSENDSPVDDAYSEPAAEPDSSPFVSEEDDEESYEAESDDDNEKIVLSPEERKEVIVTISSFPKEAEIKIAKAIVNSKYSDSRVHLLVKELIKHGDQENIIAQYEKLTGDKSLHNVGLTRLTGKAYEEKQKSFLRIIEKNVLPILARAAALVVMIAVLVMFYVTILYPTYTAGKYYKLGKKNIDENKYEYAEQNFNKAYQIQPRYGEIIAYARKFRDHERNVAAERKYEMAARQRDDRMLDFEYAEFLRDMGKYEKSLSIYNYWVDRNRKDLKAKNGRGETYLKWAEVDPSKLEDAENEFLDVLDYKLNDAAAINNLLLTYIKMDNHKKVIDTYHWAAAYLKKQDYKTQIKTAGYLIDSGDLNEARRILISVGPLVPKKPPYPEYDYQMARYNKALSVRPQERQNLESAKAKMEMLSGKDIKRIFGSEKAFNRFQADVYNNLGENYYETSRTDIRAFKMFDMATSLNPDFGKAYYNLGNFAYLTKADREEALRYYTEAESKGFSNDIMNYNMGWLYYKKGDYDKAYTKIDNLLKKSPDADSLKFMKGTILLNMLQYDLAYSELLEVYDKFNTFRQGNGPLDLELKEHRNAVKMLYQSSNNLGAALYGKYRRTKRYQYFAESLKYFTEAVKYFDIADPVNVPRTHSGGITEKAVPYLNLKMALYPDVFGKTESALIDDEFNQYEYFY